MYVKGLFPLIYINIMPKAKTPIIEQIFLIYRDGRLISYATINTEEHYDEDIVGGMLTAVMKLISYAFGEMDEDITSIDEYKFGFGERSLLLEMGEDFFIAIVVLGTEYESLLVKTRAIVQDIERQFESVLDDWPGELNDFEGVDEIITSLLPMDDLSESERKAVLKGGIRNRVFKLWSSKYAQLLQKSLMPKTSLWQNLNLQLNSDFKKGHHKKSNKEGSSGNKDKE
jgi:hypothetical protein